MTESSAKPLSPKVHWLVRMNHRNRSFFDGLLFLALAAHLSASGAGAVVWALLVMQFLVCPHLQYAWARHARDQRAAEMQNLSADGVMGGLWAAGLGLPLWVAFTLFIGNCLNMVVFYGYRGLWRLAATWGGAVVAMLVSGWGAPLQPATDLPTALLCIVATTLYLIMFAYDGFRRAMDQHQANGRLRTQNDEIRALQALLLEQAVRDPLTGLYNRRHLSAVADELLARCRSTGAPVSVVLIDIDHFKDINDTHGHAAGDATLQVLARLMLGHVRPQDIACRYGGEEFLLLMAEAPLAIAAERAEQLRRTFASTPIRHQDAALSATLSCGVATFPDHARGAGPAAPATDLIGLADKALYRAKREGRNRVATAGPAVAADAAG